MKALLKYAVVLALGVGAGFYAHRPPSLEELARLTWLDEIKVIINKALAPAKPQAADASVDLARAALVDEDLDYRIAQRNASLDGWRSFLAIHANGVHAESARAEAERLLREAEAPAPAVVEVSEDASPDATGADEIAGSDPPSLGTKIAALTPDEICKRDADRLERLRSSPTSEEAQRFANELGCEELRPELSRLVESLSHAAPAQAAAEVSEDASPDVKATNQDVRSDPPSPGTEIATLTPDEICKRDGDRLERLRGSPTSEEAQRFTNELGCDKLRPQLSGLIASLGYAAPAPAAAPPRRPGKVGSTLGPRWRAPAPPSRPRWTASAPSLQPTRHANRCALKSACSWRVPSLPPALLALLDDLNSSAFRRTPANARLNHLRER